MGGRRRPRERRRCSGGAVVEEGVGVAEIVWIPALVDQVLPPRLFSPSVLPPSPSSKSSTALSLPRYCGCGLPPPPSSRAGLLCRLRAAVARAPVAVAA